MGEERKREESDGYDPESILVAGLSKVDKNTLEGLLIEARL